MERNDTGRGRGFGGWLGGRGRAKVSSVWNFNHPVRSRSYGWRTYIEAMLRAEARERARRYTYQIPVQLPRNGGGGPGVAGGAIRPEHLAYRYALLLGADRRVRFWGV